MSAREQKRAFDDALARLERAMETPLVPGEVEPWAQAVVEAVEAFEPLLAEQQDTLHAREFDAIQTEDSGLAHRVEQLRKQDGEIRTAYGGLKSEAANLLARAGALEPEEKQAQQTIDRLKDRGLPLVIRIREQELAIATWLSEAVGRDRGVQD